MTDPPIFPCPNCATARSSADADCVECGWTRAKPPESTDSPTGLRCPCCNASRFERGQIQSYGDFLSLTYKGPASLLAQVTEVGREWVRARKCLSCGHLMLFAKDSDRW